ncbi:hypothetical protein GDO81_004517 [Engystomops pustulosus]|uniref:Uncharacterized protein n=1 Tax=Engystomops pustulosus TaxID=76066 RepID=A0AAV6ZSP3_ENGPU|nr:hypothetical protein GDO81_004517 [Engystomops pustulosus]
MLLSVAIYIVKHIILHHVSILGDICKVHKVTQELQTSPEGVVYENFYILEKLTRRLLTPILAVTVHMQSSSPDM